MALTGLREDPEFSRGWRATVHAGSRERSSLRSSRRLSRWCDFDLLRRIARLVRGFVARNDEPVPPQGAIMKKQAQPKKPKQEQKKDKRSEKQVVVLSDLELKHVSGGRTAAAFCTTPWD